MPYCCCVPGCRSNHYKDGDVSVPIFSFPKDQTKAKAWISAIQRSDFKPSPSSRVCIKHFDERFIVKEDSVVRPDGTVLCVTRNRAKLTDDAVPSILYNEPTYTPQKLPLPTQTPTQRAIEGGQRVLSQHREEQSKDIIESFISLKTYFESNCIPIVKNVNCNIFDDRINVFNVIYNKEHVPKVEVSLVIKKDLSFVVTKNDFVINNIPKTCPVNFCQPKKISKISEINALCEWLFEKESSVRITTTDKLQRLNEIMDEISGSSNNEVVSRKLTFYKEQINLALQKQIRYCTRTLIWFATIFFCFPAAYKSIRKSNLLTMPHPRYLKTFTSNVGNGCSTIDPAHVNYMKTKFENLEDHEKIVNLLADEVYVKPELSYRGGKLEGVVHQTSKEKDSSVQLATTIQTFMITSLFSKTKDVVGLFPCKDLDGKYLHDLILQVLKMLTTIGYNVLSIITDNNSTNRNAFAKLNGGTLMSSFINPYDNRGKQKVFLLFDSVHLFKSIRNNWLNQTDCKQTFIFPKFEKFDEICTASVSDLKSLHKEEENSIIKLAPALNKKVLHPTSVERQKVDLCVKFFDEKNVAALKYVRSKHNANNEGTISFLEVVIKWWKIMNVSHVFKGDRFNDPCCQPISTLNDENFLFLQRFVLWLSKWNELQIQGERNDKKRKRNGKLTAETQLALQHTTSTLIKIIEYLKKAWSVDYILLSKFQNDPLEERFGQYRQMSGGCYNITVQQILESEKKLKTVSIIELFSASKKEIKISDLHINIDTITSYPETEEIECNEHSEFEDIYEDIEFMDVSDNDLVCLTYIGGYVCYKLLKMNKCKSCEVTLLNSNKDMIVSNINNEYLRIVDRGSLKYPSDYIVNVLTVGLKLFKTIISERYEYAFINSECQRKVLVDLISDAVDLFLLNNPTVCASCNSPLMTKCITIFSNILLNNYCKCSKEKFVEKKSNKKRKLDKLTQ